MEDMVVDRSVMAAQVSHNWCVREDSRMKTRCRRRRKAKGEVPTWAKLLSKEIEDADVEERWARAKQEGVH